jgi:hypothetical protein
MVARAKDSKPYIDWKNRPFAKDAKAEERRQQGEKWSALAEFIRKHGGAVVSVPGIKTLRIEVGKDSSAKLTSELARLGYNVAHCGSVTRVSGAPSISPRDERMFGTPSAFTECNVIEVRLDGK